jgi:hypothetical protein
VIRRPLPIGLVMLLRSLISIAIVLVPMAGRADAPIRLDGDDVEFQFAGLVVEGSHLGTNINVNRKPSSKRLCGFAIRGNQRNRANPHVEWDLNIDEIVTPERTAAGVSAGTFDVVDHKRIARSPITHLSFTLPNASDPIVAEIRGVPNADNAIVALLEPEPASRLFEEFQTERPILISLQYAAGGAEQLEVRGFRDRRKFGGGKNSYFNECLRGLKTFLPGDTITIHH